VRVILATVGTRGDVQPMLALAKALVRRGHDPVLACPASFAPWVEAHDVAQCDLGEDLHASIAGTSAGPARTPRGLKRHFTEQLTRQAPQLLAIARGADAIVTTGMAWTAPSVAEKLGIPAFVLLPSVAALRSRFYPPPVLPWFGLPAWLNAALWALNDAAMNSTMGAPLNAARALLQLPPVARFADHLFVDTPVVLAADPALLPVESAAQLRPVGPLLLDDFDPLDEALEDWLARGDPPIYVGFGSMAGFHPERVGRLLAQALRGRRCIVSGSAALALAAGLPSERCFVVGDVAHPQLFSRVACVVHHGGAGTTTSALRAGVPQVLLPLLLDQHLHAHVLARTGLAPRAPRMAKVTANALRHAVRDAFALSARRRRDAADRIQCSDAGAAIVDILERAVGC